MKIRSTFPKSKSELSDPVKNEVVKSPSVEKSPGVFTRRGFILGAVSMAVTADIVFSRNLFSAVESSLSGDLSAAKLNIIDTHTHFYDPTRAIPVGRDLPLPWPSPKSTHLYKSTLPSDWEKLARPLGMTGTVVVEAGTTWLEDNDWMLKLAEKYKSITGYIGNLSGTAIDQGTAVPVWDDLSRFRKEVSRLAKNPIFRGIRVPGRSLSSDLANGRYPHFEILADAGLVIDINGGPSEDLVALARAVPSLTIVIDHMFGFNVKTWSGEKWMSDIKALAVQKNIVMKVSGLVEGCPEPQTDADSALKLVRGALDHVYQSFGENRLVFGTNWPVSEPKAEMAVITDIVHKYFEPKGKKVLAKVFAGNAKKVYQYVNR